MSRAVNIVDQRTFPIATHRMEPQHDMVLHHHDNLELVIIAGGEGLHRTRDGSWPLRRGDVFVVPVSMPHGFERCHKLQLVNIVYDDARLALPLRRLSALPGYHALMSLEPRLRGRQDFAGHLHLDEEQVSWLLSAARELDLELRQRAPGWEEAASAGLLRILVRLARLYATHDSPEARLTVKLGAVLAHIDAHLDRELDVDALCRIGGMSKSTLERGFRALFGVPVMRHVIGRRIESARAQLIAGDAPVAEIARRVGIPDANYFSRLFRKHTGSTPRSVREYSRR
jgi:AraC family L-rhamnose operon transcriptional activator RhaR/AraC family L-rhamnose operon regulatory protein RhaS